MRRSAVIQLALMALPWSLRRLALNALFGYQIDPSARIGLSLVAPREHLVMEAGSYIGHGNLARGMDRITMGPLSRIGHLNWIYAIPRGSPELIHVPGRRPELVLERQAVIMGRHVIDCSNTVRVGASAIVAGFRTQIITHGLNMIEDRIFAKPITVGRWSFVGTRSILLGGARLPDYSALGAGSTLRDAFSDTHCVYSGVPAQRAGGLPSTAKFFVRDLSRPPTR